MIEMPFQVGAFVSVKIRLPALGEFLGDVTTIFGTVRTCFVSGRGYRVTILDDKGVWDRMSYDTEDVRLADAVTMLAALGR
jgi:hypothetical protein